jgi:hypothetical protein
MEAECMATAVPTYFPMESEDMDINILEHELLKVEKQLNQAICTCQNYHSTPFIVCQMEKQGDFKYFTMDVQLLQKLSQRTFDHLSVIYSVVVTKPNLWFTRPKIAELCCKKANKKPSSFLNALSTECKTAFNDPRTKDAIIELKDGRWPTKASFILGKKTVGRSLYTFVYYNPSS